MKHAGRSRAMVTFTVAVLLGSGIAVTGARGAGPQAAVADSPSGLVVQSYSFSRSTLVIGRKRSKPIDVRATVVIPADADYDPKHLYVHFLWQRDVPRSAENPSGSAWINPVGGHCRKSNPAITCVREGRLLHLRFAYTDQGDWDARRYPGNYASNLEVWFHRAGEPNNLFSVGGSVTLPTQLKVRRAVRLGVALNRTHAQAGDHVKVKASMLRVAQCPDTQTAASCSFPYAGYYKTPPTSQQLEVWFWSKHHRAVRVGTCSTNHQGRCTVRTVVERSGRWQVRFAGTRRDQRARSLSVLLRA